jgi:hypothetical protein
MRRLLFIILSLLSVCFYGQENIWYGHDTLLIPTQKAPQKYFCFGSKENCLIRSKEDVKEKIYPPFHHKLYPECDPINSDSFNLDFTKYNIIFVHTSNNTCSNKYTLITFRLLKLLKEKKYLLLINAKGFCEDKVGRYWDYREIIPKIEDDYTFEIQIKKH